MSILKFTDDFEDLRNWEGDGSINSTLSFSGSTSASATRLVSRRTFWDASRMSIRFYDRLEDFSIVLGIGGTDILSLSGNTTHYLAEESEATTIGPVARSENWHLIEIEIKDNYRISVDGTIIFMSDLPARRGFDLTLNGGIWDNLIVEKDYEDDYMGGTGGRKDLQVKDLTVNTDGTISYSVEPGYFYLDDIEYYYFATMGVVPIEPNPSGNYLYPSGLPYMPGEPYFVVSQDEVSTESGYVRTPLNRDYVVTWEPDVSGYQPCVSGAYDNILVYEAGTERLFDITEPISSTKLVLTDEGGVAGSVRSESSYVDYVTVGSSYQVFAVVLDKYGGPVIGEIVTWKRIDNDDNISDLGASTTNDKGVATKNIIVTDDEPFHIYAKVNPESSARWIRVPLAPATLQGIIFQLDNNEIYFDSMEARSAMGQNIWGETWGSNPGEATGLGHPFPTTHGQWEDENPEQMRPPIDTNIIANEAIGSWNANDFEATYPAVVGDAGGDTQTFMDDMRVARNGFWGPTIISGVDIRNDVTIGSGQVLNHTSTYEIDRDYAMTSGTYLDVYGAGGVYDSVYYVFYQPGTDYVGGAYDPTGDFYFRGVALYDETLNQSNSKISDLLSDAVLGE
jgi:hypothetical protein